MICAHPEINWQYDILSKNVNITWDIIQQNPQHKWCYNYMSSNPNITWEIVKEHPNELWNEYRLAMNPSITLDILHSAPKFWEDGYASFIAGNPNLQIELPTGKINKKKLNQQQSITL